MSNKLKKILAISLTINIVLLIAFAYIFYKDAINQKITENEIVIEDEPISLGNKKQTVNIVTDFIKADGSNTPSEIQAIFDNLDPSSTVIFPNGIYIVNNLLIPSNTKVILSDNSKLLAPPNMSADDRMIVLSGVNNIEISGGIIDGNRENIQLSSSEWKHCIRIINASYNINLHNINLVNSGGDGICIQGANNINLSSITCENNYRSGISIIYGENISLYNCKFINSNGTAPNCGINVEPNYENEVVNNISIENCTIENNKGNGIQVLTKDVATQNIISIKNNNISNNDFGGISLYNTRDITIDSNIVSNNGSAGFSTHGNLTNLKLINNIFSNNGNHQALIIPTPSTTKNLSDILIEGNTFKNSPNPRSGLQIQDYRGYTIENTYIINNSFIDDQEVPTQKYGLCAGNASKIIVGKNTYSGNTAMNEITIMNKITNIANK